MSVLLNALKKAAIEKQHRENSNPQDDAGHIVETPSQPVEKPPYLSEPYQKEEVIELCVELEDIRDELEKEKENQNPKTNNTTETEKEGLSPADGILENNENRQDSETNYKKIDNKKNDAEHQKNQTLKENHNNIEPKSYPNSDSTENEKSSNKETTREESTNIAKEHAGNQKAALATLISNSQKNHKKNKTIKLITYLLLMIIILLSVGLYYLFYIVDRPSAKMAVNYSGTFERDLLNSSLRTISGNPIEEVEGIIALQKDLIGLTANHQKNQDNAESSSLQDSNIVSPIGKTSIEDLISAETSAVAPYVVKDVKPRAATTLKKATEITSEKAASAANTQTTRKTTETPKNAIITIKKGRSKANNLAVLINKGFNDYQRGAFTQAAEAYEKALTINRYHRDALLGLAAIALKQGRQEDALGFYQKRLSKVPSDSYAMAGLMSLFSSQGIDTKTESSLNQLIKSNPNQDYLLFLQGTLFANSQRWNQAQSAFFNAWSLNKNNPDYAFNLAVSLDQINKPQQALRFYEMALLNKKTDSRFNLDQVNQRIAQIKGQ